ncbi:hypothetical protein PCASD_24848 [Puccinia coronata f. sp. avenae]|uniref:Uncharacterized protein n=1 Tax=Puccinia coronata f. sp. avenae TaxID=200324 RepID=A0A2N5S3P5_9BASI|nr:hypothetical protein PCASD_24848 [Puccinia coronata f. sp. avenae]
MEAPGALGRRLLKAPGLKPTGWRPWARPFSNMAPATLQKRLVNMTTSELKIRDRSGNLSLTMKDYS